MPLCGVSLVGDQSCISVNEPPLERAVLHLSGPALQLSNLKLPI